LLALDINVIVAVGNDDYQGINDISGENLPTVANPDYGAAATLSTIIGLERAVYVTSYAATDAEISDKTLRLCFFAVKSYIIFSL